MAPDFDYPPWFYVDLDAKVEHPMLRDLRDHLDSLKGKGRLPNQSTFDPLKIPSHFGNLFMIKVEGDCEVFTYSLIGTRITEALGRDATGKRVEDTFPEDHPILAYYRHISKAQIPARTYGQVEWVDKQFKDFESLMVPLLDDEGRVVKIVGEAIYTGSEG